MSDLSNFKEVINRHFLEYIFLQLLEEQGINVDNYQFKDECVIQSSGEHTRNNRVALNFTTRLSITYNWNRYFINVNGQFNNFNYKHNAMHGHLNDWYINASVGVRL